MGRRRRIKYSAVSNINGEAEDREDSMAHKRPRLHEQLSILKLSEEQEDRLGRWSSAVQWIIKIAQDRGSNACLAFSFVGEVDLSDSSCKVVLQSFDGQQVTIVMRGTWSKKATGVLSTAREGKIVVLSGLGAKIASSGNDVVFEAGKIMMEVLQGQDPDSQEYLEVVENRIINEPRTFQGEKQDTISMASLANKSAHVTSVFNSLDRTDLQKRVSLDQEDCIRTLGPTMRNGPSLESYQTPAPSSERDSMSATPAWLKTPAVDLHTSSHPPGPSKLPDRKEIASPLAMKTKSNLKEAKMLGTVSLYGEEEYQN